MNYIIPALIAEEVYAGEISHKLNDGEVAIGDSADAPDEQVVEWHAEARQGEKLEPRG